MMFIFIFVGPALFLSHTLADNESAKNACMIPPAPANGQHKANRLENPDLNKTYEFLALNYTCNPGYEILGNEVRLCIKGTWSSDEPKCLRMCKLDKNPSVEYTCVVKGVGVRPCKEFEPEGTLIRPKCSAEYYFFGDLPNMRCVNGSWNYCPTCQPVCGVFPTDELAYQAWLTPAGMTRVPWFATIYKKSINKQYKGLCSGTLVTKGAVLTAAHCFWDRQIKKASSASEFAVAVGKLLYGWNAQDENAQKSDVAEIIIHPDYPISSTKESQNDIAVVILAEEFTFGPDVRPACLDFDMTFEQEQLENTRGLYPYWNPVEGDQGERALRAFGLPYMPTQDCTPIFREDFRKYITYDKMCVGYSSGVVGTCRVGVVTHGNNGGGIAFPEVLRGVKRYYLRGIVTLTSSYKPCVNGSLGIFTQISKHENFIKEYI